MKILEWIVSSANAAQSAGHSSGNIEVLANVSQNTIYLMGGSFILGSLFTILVLIFLDFMRRNADSKD